MVSAVKADVVDLKAKQQQMAPVLSHCQSDSVSHFNNVVCADEVELPPADPTTYFKTHLLVKV